jgi:hypothetical protein
LLCSPDSHICLGDDLTIDQQGYQLLSNRAIHTIHNKKIVGVTQTVTQDKFVVCFEKDSLGENIPSQKTIISKNHKVFYKGKMIKAIEFASISKRVYKVKYTGEILYNVLMEKHEKMVVNNLLCETLHPENIVAKIYMVIQNLKSEDKEKLIKDYNEHVIKIFNKKLRNFSGRNLIGHNVDGVLSDDNVFSSRLVELRN